MVNDKAMEYNAKVIKIERTIEILESIGLDTKDYKVVLNTIESTLNEEHKTKLKDKAVVINEDYKKALRTLNTNEKFDIIFIDPPYKEDIAVDSIIDIIHESRLKENGIMIIETDEIERDLREINKIENIKIIDQRKYGRASLIFIKEA